MDGWMDGWMVGLDGWMDGRMDGWIDGIDSFFLLPLPSEFQWEHAEPTFVIFWGLTAVGFCASVEERVLKAWGPGIQQKPWGFRVKSLRQHDDCRSWIKVEVEPPKSACQTHSNCHVLQAVAASCVRGSVYTNADTEEEVSKLKLL